MVEKIVQHKHCRECGKAVSPKKEFCSTSCRESWEAKMTKKKKQLTYLYIGSIVAMILAVLLMMRWV